jgi:transcriptional regulator with XRE-family HTH domain
MTATFTKLHAWRVTQGWSLQETSDVTGCSISFLSRAERGLRNVSPATRVLIARRVGAGVADLFEVEPVDEDDLDAGVTVG